MNTMKKIMNVKCIFIFAILLSIYSCKEDEALTLTLHTPQQVDNTIALKWDETNISGFQYYMVMRSSDGKYYQTINDITTTTSDAFQRGMTTFNDNSYPLGVDTLYYKVMAIGNETASSKDLCYVIESPIVLLKGSFIDMFYMDESEKISVLYYDYSSYKSLLNVFDLKTGIFSPESVNVDLSSSVNWYLWGKYNGKTEFYNYDSDYSIYVYDASTLQTSSTLQVPGYMWYQPFATNNKGMIYILDYYSLYSISRASNTYTQYESANYSYDDKLYYNSKDNKLYAVDYNQTKIFDLDDEGNVTGEEVYNMGSIYSKPLYVENSSFFIVECQGMSY